MKPIVITHFLRELQDGFYVDINPDSDDNSSTKILDSQYRWRGISISSTELQFARSDMFKSYILDLDANPKGLVDALYETHPGSMIHYLRVNNVKNISELFNKTYEEDVIKNYNIQFVYPHLNFLCAEIVGDVTPELTHQLYTQFDLKPFNRFGDSHWFANEVLIYLL